MSDVKSPSVVEDVTSTVTGGLCRSADVRSEAENIARFNSQACPGRILQIRQQRRGSGIGTAVTRIAQRVAQELRTLRGRPCRSATRRRSIERLVVCWATFRLPNGIDRFVSCVVCNWKLLLTPYP